MKIFLKGIEETLQQIFTHQEIGVEELKGVMQSLEESFNLLSQKWSLQILYTLFLKNVMGFGELKKILKVNSRTLSDKLRNLADYGYITRMVEKGPPLRVKYALTNRGRNTILLALPLLYYSSGNLT
jgi:DNA-binding HxlR family transcriptional regulator